MSIYAYIYIHKYEAKTRRHPVSGTLQHLNTLAKMNKNVVIFCFLPGYAWPCSTDAQKTSRVHRTTY